MGQVADFGNGHRLRPGWLVMGQATSGGNRQELAKAETDGYRRPLVEALGSG